MNQIVTKELIDVRYALGSSETAKSRYNQIKGTFPEGHEYRIFAEPIILSEGNKISWVTEYDGAIINYSQLSEEEQSKAKDMLSEQMKRLFKAAKGFEDNSLVDFLYKCIEIPDLNDIYIVRKGVEDKVVITQWGFMKDTPGAEKGLLERIINAKKIPMVFNVVYIDDESPAVGAEVHFENQDKKQIHKSNEQAQITLPEIKVDSFVKAYEMDGEEEVNIHKFTCYEYGKYLIKVTRKVDMKFKVVDSNEKVLSNETFHFKWNEEKETLTTDENGYMILPGIKLETEIKVYQEIEDKEENVNRFICEKDKNEYLIVIQIEEPVVEEPKVYNMKFKVVDDDGDIVPNAEVTVKFNGQTKTLRTDELGFAVLENVEPGTKVNVKAKGKKQKKNKKKK